jgi:hypothetical protein
MAFFFEYDPTNTFRVADMMNDLRKGYPNHMLNWHMGDPVERVGNTIIVHFHPQWDFRIDHYVNYGIVVAPGLKFKVTRLYPWNHPSDNYARSAWKEDQQLKIERQAELKMKEAKEHKYFDDKGRPVPPPPALMRTTNSYEVRLNGPIDTSYLDIRGVPLKNEDDWMDMYDSDSDSMPPLESLNSGSTPSLESLDYSNLAPFSPRSISPDPCFPDPFVL